MTDHIAHEAGRCPKHKLEATCSSCKAVWFEATPFDRQGTPAPPGCKTVCKGKDGTREPHSLFKEDGTVTKDCRSIGNGYNHKTVKLSVQSRLCPPPPRRPPGSSSLASLMITRLLFSAQPRPHRHPNDHRPASQDGTDALSGPGPRKDEGDRDGQPVGKGWRRFDSIRSMESRA